MWMRRSFVALVACLTLVASVVASSATAGKNATKAPLKIGVAAALTGPFASAFGKPFANGVVLAVKQINAKGGIDGHKIQLMIEDHKGDASTGVLVLQKFVSEGVPVVFSNFTAILRAQGPIATANNVLLINPAGSESTIALASRNIYTTRPYSTREFIVSTRYMKQKGSKAVAIVASDNANGRNADVVLRAQLKAKGIKVTGDTQFYPAASTVDFSSVIAKVRAQDPDTIFIYGTGNDGGVFVKQAVAQGLKQQFYSYGGFSVPSVQEAAGDAASRVIWTVPVDYNPAAYPAHATFQKQWKRNFPDVAESAFSMLHYDAMKCVLVPVIRAALKSGGYNGPNLLKAIRAHKQAFTGCVSGEMKFTPGRDSILPMALQTAKDGKVVTVQQVSVDDQVKKLG